MLKIRLRRMGKRHSPFYRVVVSDSRRTPTASAVDEVGHYDPQPTPPRLVLNLDRLRYWQQQGAQLSPTVSRLMQRAESGTLEAPVAEEATKPARAAKPVAKAKEQPAKAEKPAVEPEEPPAAAAAEPPTAEEAEETPQIAAESAEEAPQAAAAPVDEAPQPAAETETPAETTADEPAAADESEEKPAGA